MRRCCALVLLALAFPAHAARVRVFAVQPKVRVVDAETHQRFHDTMAALIDASFPGRAALVQPGVDDVASHLAPADPTAPAAALVLFPEDVGLVTALVGTRGATARAQTTAAGAIVSLLGPYAPQMAYYAARFPNQPLVRTLLLALTDTVYRSFYETFRELAMTRGVWLAASANVAPARRVDDPVLVAQLRDPDEPARAYAYEAATPRVTNATFVFGPDGEVLVPDGSGGTRRSPSETGGVVMPSNEKTYLTEIEEPPPGNAAGLALAFGFVRDTDVVDTPVGRLGIVTSKPAWMPDVNDRLAARGATVVLQPEAFSEWAYAAAPWQPDVFKEGGFATLQKILGFRLNVAADLVGNFFDVTFDGQSAILGRRRKGGAPGGWIGQAPDTGFLAVAPWIEPDPGPPLALDARRAMLAADGARLLPGSGVPCPDPLAAGACENGYREAVIHADVDLPDGATTGPPDPVRAPPPRFTAAVRVSGPESTPVAQHDPRVAADGGRVWVVWHEERPGALPNVFLATSADGGRTFSAPVRVSDHPAGSVAELHPAIAARRSRVLVVWQEFAAGRDDDRGRIVLARLTRSGRKRGHDVRVDDLDASGKWLPTVAFAGSAAVVAWIDERDLGPEGEPLEHVWAARGRGGGLRFEKAVRVDAGAPVATALHLDNKWAPAIAANGRAVHVAWADFRQYNWDIWLATSTDGGGRFGPNVRVDDFPDLERIDERPSLAIGRRGRVHVAWTDLRARRPDTDVLYARSDDRGAHFSANRPLDDAPAATSQWQPSLAADGDRLFVAWQDTRLGNDDVFFTESRDGGTTFAAAERVDDTGDGRSEQTRPSLAEARRGRHRTCVVAWEDDRGGDPDVYLARRACD